jgi:predicted transcriptional regulator
MPTAKEEIIKLIDAQTDDSTYEELAREIAFRLMVHRGLKDSDAGRTISDEEMEARIRSWSS